MFVFVLNNQVDTAAAKVFLQNAGVSAKNSRTKHTALIRRTEEKSRQLADFILAVSKKSDLKWSKMIDLLVKFI